MKENEGRTCVTLLSGGLDSSTLLASLVASGERPVAISFDYGQRHTVELTAARMIAGFYDVPHQVVDISDVNKLLKGSALTDPTVEVPEGHYAAENMRITVVPNRNAMMLSVATAWAVSLGAKAVYFAAHAGDHAIYPDCREPFVTAFQEAMQRGNDVPDFRIQSPFVHMTKAQILSLGLGLKVPYEHTWSCYNGTASACGKCGTCVERLEAFYENGAEDPLIYRDREWWMGQLTFEQRTALYERRTMLLGSPVAGDL
jgi:7-cyano-7-deazaguanine synthase